MAPYERVYNQPNDADTEVNAKGTLGLPIAKAMTGHTLILTASALANRL